MILLGDLLQERVHWRIGQNVFVVEQGDQRFVGVQWIGKRVDDLV